MAITFTQELSESKVLNAFNNNVTIFTSDTIGTLDSAEITATVQGITITITPDPDGVFRYNFHKLFKTIINQNNFNDNIFSSLVVDPPQYVYADATVFKEIVIEFKVIFDDTSEETVSKTFKVLKSVIQQEDHNKGLLNSDNTTIALLLPFTSTSERSYHATYFKGFPFDVSIFSNIARQVTIKNVGSADTTIVNLLKGVNRLFFSSGGTNLTFEDELPLYDGVNRIEFTIDGEPTFNTLTLYLTKNNQSCGTYLKWFNQAGGWSHYLFNLYKETRKIKSLGTFDQDFEDVEDTLQKTINIGVTANDSLKLFYAGVDENTKKLIDSLFESPMIYRCLTDSFQMATEKDWLIETIKARSVELRNKNKNIHEGGFELQKVERNKMTI